MNLEKVIDVQIINADVDGNHYTDPSDCGLARGLKRLFPFPDVTIDVGGSTVDITTSEGCHIYNIEEDWEYFAFSNLQRLHAEGKEVNHYVKLTFGILV